MAFYDSFQAEQYRGAVTKDSYDLREGLFVLPVAEEPPELTAELAAWTPVAIVRAHAPYRLRTSAFTYKKDNNPPVIPSPVSVGAFGFIGGELNFDLPAPNTSGFCYNWTVNGAYVFVENCRSSPEDGFVLTNLPFSTVTQQVNASLPPATPNLGAIAYAGADARRGVAQGNLIDGSKPFWLYNTTSYFPPILINDEILNGGSFTPPTAAPVETITGSVLGFNYSIKGPPTATAPEVGNAPTGAEIAAANR